VPLTTVSTRPLARSTNAAPCLHMRCGLSTRAMIAGCRVLVRRHGGVICRRLKAGMSWADGQCPQAGDNNREER
jgi:hypothetical protein